MGYAILPALISDIERVYDSYFKAFNGALMGDTMLKILFPGGVGTEEFRRAHTAGTLSWWHHSNCQYTYKCVDTETGEIVGIALGDIYLKEGSEKERKNHGVGWLEGAARERAEAVFNPLHDVREKLFGGRRYIYTHVIALYENMGYETLDEKIVHKAELMSMPNDIEVPLMVKMPACAGGMTFQEWRAAGYPPFSEVKRLPANPVVNVVPGEKKLGGSAVAVEVQVQEVQI
ncbi:hypothetical protein CSHISOI_10765 [Colletotrichum shisoi]|uniref:Acyltransferase SID5 n=1 Tax=Colletotrichum shisoi TaxID=2078593 RepID=A0A5Q4BDB5_9PEZI|nr:hypothetical protein CSHISOI_10765 [Colletotrichum shisoi]